MPPTPEQQTFIEHIPAAFVEACPGAGKTRAIVSRIARIAPQLGSRRGIAALSFTNSAVEELLVRCHEQQLDAAVAFPSFVGTFDAFLRHFFFASEGIDGVATKPMVIDSWERLGVEVRLRGARRFAGGAGVPLDWFDPETGTIDTTVIGMAPLRTHAQQHQNFYQQEAARRREALRRRGYVSAADVRVDVVRRLQRPAWGAAIGRALAARFTEVIVDEAQDCNPLDCRIIAWLQAAGLPVTIVADPDQAIYGFRQGVPADLQALAARFAAGSRLNLTGNFRSSPSICSAAATLRRREQPDTSLEEAATFAEPLYVLAYAGRSVRPEVGQFFVERMQAVGLTPNDGVVLAHGRKNALRACGHADDEDTGDSNVSRVAAAVGGLWSGSASARSRERALGAVESILLDLMGLMDDDAMPAVVAEANGIDRRWLRRSSLELLSRVPRACEDSDDARQAWVGSLRTEVQRLRIPYGANKNERTHFQIRAGGGWHRNLAQADLGVLRSATIHEAKGRQYEAVCVVIPPDYQQSRRTESLLSAWGNRADDEAKRVIYVGLTRARRLAVIAVPERHCDTLTGILTRGNVDYRVQRLQ